MPKNKPSQTALDDLKRLRDSFAQSAYKADSNAAELENQARIAREEARLQRDRVRVMEEAIALLETHEQSRVAAVTIGGLKKKPTAKLSSRRFFLLIDGSGSMAGGPLNSAVSASVQIREEIGKKSGAAPDVAAAFFGDPSPVALNLTDPAAVAKAKGCLNLGTDLAPCVKTLAGQLGKDKPCHALIIGDGDVFDPKEAAEALTKMLLENQQVTVDVISMSRPNSAMQKMIENVAAQLPEARRPKIVVTTPESVSAVAAQLLAERLTQKQSRKKAKTPAPGK